MEIKLFVVKFVIAFLCSKRSNFHGKPTDVIPDIWEVGNFQRFMVWCTHFDYIKIKSSFSAEKKMPASFFMSLWFLSLNFHAVTAPRKTILWLIINASQTIIANWCFIMISFDLQASMACSFKTKWECKTRSKNHRKREHKNDKFIYFCLERINNNEFLKLNTFRFV